jgi:hypothetical protein
LSAETYSDNDFRNFKQSNENNSKAGRSSTQARQQGVAVHRDFDDDRARRLQEEH